MPKLDLAAYKYPTGTIIANRAVTVNGDYKKIAYIPDEMPDTVKWYVKSISPTMKAYVSKFVKPLKDKKPIQTFPIAEKSINQNQINLLKATYGDIEKINPNSPAVKKLIMALKKLSKDDLELLSKAKINFVSSIAKSILMGSNIFESTN